MVRTGLLETMARADLDAVLEMVADGYRPGALDAMAAQDPEWRAALERAEREVGALYDALGEADLTLSRWRQAVAELYRVWSRVNQGPVGAEVSALPELEEVA